MQIPPYLASLMQGEERGERLAPLSDDLASESQTLSPESASREKRQMNYDDADGQN